MQTRLGLTAIDATARLAADGPNVLPVPAVVAPWRRLVGEFVHFFAIMLWVAAVLALLAGLPQLTVAIVAVVLVNGLFAFIQERRADRAAERLRTLLPTLVTVRRDGETCRIGADDVVVGDILVLEGGDRVPADGVAVVADWVLLDTSMLTGESRPEQVGRDAEVFAGTFVVEGMAEVHVTATGAATRLAGIAQMTTATPAPPTPLTLGLHAVVRSIAAIAVGVGALFFVVSLLLGNGASDGFVFAVGVTVALVPEALLPTVTLSLAWGAEQMAKRQVLVRHLEAVETLGSVTFVCTDKTGTLTMNQMEVVAAWTPSASVTVRGDGYGPSAEVTVDGDRDSVQRLALAGARCGTGRAVRDPEHADVWVPRGDPMEAAIDAFARRCGAAIDADRDRRPERARWPFDPRRRRMSVLVADEVIVKGATDSVLEGCRPIADTEVIHASVDAMTARGLRVLVVAVRPIGAAEPFEGVDPDTLERDLELLGVVGLEDPPRPDVSGALAACRRAGVRVAMITGDHPDTARAIATEVGLRIDDAPVLTGPSLPTDEAALGEALDHDGVVVARVSPEDKVRIARALRARGHVVAMTGDGVNDAPALHEADIGVAMGASGTDVAREAADLVLLDDRFESIVAGIEQGRATYVNIRRFLTYHLTDNVAELTPFVVWMLSGGQYPLALGVLQILALDIGTDTLSAVALGAEPPSAHLLDGPPVSGRLMNAMVVRRAFGILGPTIAAVSMVAFMVSYLDVSVERASGATFLAVVFGQKANVFACRSSTRRPGQLGWTTNRLVLLAITVELVFALTVVLVPPIANALDQGVPPWQGWVLALAAIPAVLAVDAADKWWRSNRATAYAPDQGDGRPRRRRWGS